VRRLRWACGLFALCFALFAPLAARAQDAALAVHLLDYIAADFAEAVADGRVRNAEEYKEMTEFAASVVDTIGRLEPGPQRAALEASARSLAGLVAGKADPPAVAAAATQLRQSVVAAYHVAVGPRRAPDLARGSRLFAEHCARCHGATGLGDGPAAKGMEPAPANFHDRERQAMRSAYGLFNTIIRGVEGTGMRAYTDLSEDDRWSLAYVAANFGATSAERARGEALWSGGLREGWSSQSAVAGRTPNEVAAGGGMDAAAILAYLRANPTRLEEGKPSPLDSARESLARSVESYAQGRREEAARAALAAYLDGFELVEASLATVDADLVHRVEAAMIAHRNAIKDAAPEPEVRALASEAGRLLDESRAALDSSLSPAATFLASFLILLREGLEAVLVVTALLAVLGRGGQTRAIAHVHAGWIAALLAGLATWYVATALVATSGADREVTEGVTGLVAAAMLLYVGFWLHDKSHAQAWQRFLQRGADAIGPRAAWGLGLMSFLAAYREVFEVVLFYQALWAQAPGAEGAIVSGVAAALVVLGAVTWAILRQALRLPLGLFFGASGILLAALAVIMAGNGIAALQEAGWLPVTPVAFVTVSWLGIHPNAQALGTQIALAAVVGLLFRASSRGPATS
jgi:high-affinity iron transporter